MWFTETSARKIGRIAPDGAISEYPIGDPSVPCAIAAGPDGALWFSATSGGIVIGRITIGGTVTSYKISATAGLLNGISVGSDGALRATAPNDNKIFRMTTNGAVSEFPLPAADSQPNAITVGPDGGVWFTEAEKIGRLGK